MDKKDTALRDAARDLVRIGKPLFERYKMILPQDLCDALARLEACVAACDAPPRHQCRTCKFDEGNDCEPVRTNPAAEEWFDQITSDVQADADGNFYPSEEADGCPTWEEEPAG